MDTNNKNLQNYSLPVPSMVYTITDNEKTEPVITKFFITRYPNCINRKLSVTRISFVFFLL